MVKLALFSCTNSFCVLLKPSFLFSVFCEYFVYLCASECIGGVDTLEKSDWLYVRTKKGIFLLNIRIFLLFQVPISGTAHELAVMIQAQLDLIQKHPVHMIEVIEASIWDHPPYMFV